MSGDPDSDASTIGMFEAAGVPLLLAATFGKSFGLYGERVGMLSVIAPNPEIKARMQKQMALLARPETGSSPAFGAKIVEVALGDEKIKAVWAEDVKGIATELRRRRQVLRNELELVGTPGQWDFLTRQVGMFSWVVLIVMLSSSAVDPLTVSQIPRPYAIPAGIFADGE